MYKRFLPVGQSESIQIHANYLPYNYAALEKFNQTIALAKIHENFQDT